MKLTKKTQIFLLILFIIILASLAINRTNKSEIKTILKLEKAPSYNVSTVAKGQSIYQVLIKMGLSNPEVAKFTRVLGEHVDITSIQIGDTLKVRFKKDFADSLDTRHSLVHEIIYKPNIITSHILTAYPDSVGYTKKDLPYETSKKYISGSIDKSLNATLKKMGYNPGIRQGIIKPLEAAISFETDARPGDIFEACLIEKYYKEIKLPGTVVFYASYMGTRVKKKEAFLFKDDNPASALNGMYNTKGKALVTNAVRSPLDRIHVTSPFGKRIHPITGRWKFHQGIDYRGRRGTPVYAVADGKVVSAGRNGGYGKEVKIKHYGMTTQYAHLNRYYVKRGQRVRKGAKIGTVGTTGFSTGAHLHFGLMKNNKWVNPKNLRMVGAQQLKGNKLAKLRKQIKLTQADYEDLKIAYKKD